MDEIEIVHLSTMLDAITLTDYVNAPAIKDRVAGTVYRVGNEFRRWSGKQFRPVCACPKQKIPKFGLIGDKQARWCSQCTKPAAAIDITHPRCECPKKKQPKFGLIGARRARWCTDCPKPNEAIDLVSPRCACPKQKIFRIGW